MRTMCSWRVDMLHFVWLDGKLMAIIREGFDEEGYGFEEVESPECNRVGSAGTCGVTHIVNDCLPKPVLAIHGATSRVTGAALYDEGGNINRVPFTPAFSAWSGGTVGQVTLPVPGQVEQRVLFGKLAWPNTTINGIAGPSAGFINPHSGNAHCWSNRVWSNWGNASGSITVTVPALPEIAFNCSGVFLEAAEYRMRQSGATYYFPALRFPGQYADSETELHSNWNRFYDPLPWIYRQSEPIAQDPQFIRRAIESGRSTPLYSYAWNNPLNVVDSNGLWPWEKKRPGSSRNAYYGSGFSKIAGGACNCYLRIDDKTRNILNDTCWSVATTKATHNATHNSEDDCPFSAGLVAPTCDDWCKKEALVAFSDPAGPTHAGWALGTCDFPAGKYARESKYLGSDYGDGETVP